MLFYCRATGMAEGKALEFVECPTCKGEVEELKDDQ